VTKKPTSTHLVAPSAGIGFPIGAAAAGPGSVCHGQALVVDDEPAAVRLFLECLAVAGYEATGTTSVAEALELLRSRPFDVMLSDLRMPEMSGLELMVKARLEAPDMAVILITAVADVDTAIRAMRVGAYDYLVKPVSPGDVVLHVSSAIETRRHVLEARRSHERLQESCRQLQQMADVKDNLVQMLVHDLKTPLASAMGYMELLERKSSGTFSERQLRYLQHAYGSCRDVLQMTATMLDVARIERGTLELRAEPLALEPLLRDAAAAIEPLVEDAGGQVRFHCPPDVPSPQADREIVRRILGNLLSNAVKHTSRGCQIRVGAESGPDHCVVVSVADNGEGIPVEDRERVFGKFCQLKPGNRKSGAGIGLAFCKMAVEAHGGTIWVEGAPGGGSIFRFTLPLAPSGALAPGPRDTERALPSHPPVTEMEDAHADHSGRG